MARRYSTLPTGTGFSKVLGSRATKFGRACAKDAAQQKASSKVCFRRNPPKIMKLWRLRYCGCMIMADFRTVSLMKAWFAGRIAGFWGSVGRLIFLHLSDVLGKKGFLVLTQVGHFLRPH